MAPRQAAAAAQAAAGGGREKRKRTEGPAAARPKKQQELQRPSWVQGRQPQQKRPQPQQQQQHRKRRRYAADPEEERPSASSSSSGTSVVAGYGGGQAVASRERRTRRAADSSNSSSSSGSSSGRSSASSSSNLGRTKKKEEAFQSQETGEAGKEEKKKKKKSLLSSNVSTQGIKNKQRRQRLAAQLLQEKKKLKAKKKKDVRRREKRGEVVQKKTPRTIESMRRFDPTVVEPADEEITAEEETDEFSPYFKGLVTPKLMVTTNRRVTRGMYDFLKEVLYIFPNSFFYKRGPYHLKNICKFAAKENFTDLLVFQEKNKRPHGLYVVHLPEGPTSYFRLTSVKLAQEMHGAGAMTTHAPELLLNNFSTRLGCRIGRQLAALFPLTPDFVGRRVVTFHNQRDFIFFRHHRYIFENGKRTRLQEIGPRMTLKLLWLHAGLFNTKEGMYEFVWRPDLKVDRKNMLI